MRIRNRRGSEIPAAAQWAHSVKHRTSQVTRMAGHRLRQLPVQAPFLEAEPFMHVLDPAQAVGLACTAELPPPSSGLQALCHN